MSAIVRPVVWTVVSALAIAIFAFSTPPESTVAHYDALSQEVEVAQRRFNVSVELLRRADSKAVARAAAERTEVQSTTDAAPFTLVRMPGVSETFAETAREEMTQRLAALPRRDSSVRFVVALRSDSSAFPPGVPIDRSTDALISADSYAPGIITGDACVVVFRASPRSAYPRPALGGRPPLGACWWYLAFGIPGRGVSTWIDSTSGAATSSGEPSRLSFGGYARQVDEGGEAPPWYWWDTGVMACRARAPRACAALLMNRRDRALHGAQGTWSTGRRLSGFSSDARASLILHLLLIELGPDKFAGIWKADTSFEASVASAIGTSLDAWVSRQVAAATPEYHAGPTPKRNTKYSLLLFAPLFMAIGVIAVTRRGTFA